MVTVKKSPEHLSKSDINVILNHVFTGNIYYSNQDLIDKLNITIKETDDGYQVLVMRSQNQPWNRKYTPIVDALLSTHYNNGWFTLVSKSILNSEPSNSEPSNSEPSNSEPCNIGTSNPPPSNLASSNAHINVGDPIINSFLEKGFDICQAGELAKGVKSGLDVSFYEKLDMPWISMMSCRLYLERTNGRSN